MPGSHGSSLSKFHVAFHSSFTDLHSHPQCISVPFPPHPHQHLLFMLLVIAILTWVRWNLNVVLFSVFLSSSNLCSFILKLCNMFTYI
jgi:hypothetical protein